MKVARSTLAVSIALTLAALAPPAAACAFAMGDAVDAALDTLNVADRALDEGDAARAWSGVAASFDDRLAHFERAWPKSVVGPGVYEENRALRIAALAVVRSRGNVTSDPPAALAWARRVLARLAELHDGPLQQTDLAIAREESEPDAARAALEDLAKRDLVATAAGHAALGRLRALAGDSKGSAAAFEHCRTAALTARACEAPSVEGPTLPVWARTRSFWALSSTLVFAVVSFAFVSRWRRRPLAWANG